MNEEYVDEEEYIDNENDPEKVVIVPEDDYVISDNEEKIEFDEVIATVQARSKSEMDKSDFMQQEKVLDAFRKGKLR